MKIFTEKQKEWLLIKTIKEKESYAFPINGFMIYDSPSYSGKAEFINTNLFTKSLANERFYVKQIINGFCRGNFENRPKGNDVYITEEALSRRPLLEIIFLTVVFFIPCFIYNLFNKKQ